MRLPGLTMARVVGAILSVLPIDDFEPAPLRPMQVVDDPSMVPPVQAEVSALISAGQGEASDIPGIDRFAFYEAAARSFAVVQVGDPRPYGRFLIRNGQGRRNREFEPRRDASRLPAPSIGC